MKSTELMNETIFITTPRTGYIPYINQQGPIVHPIPVSRATAKQMIVDGLTVVQVDPETKKTVDLTLQNIFPGEGESQKPDPAVEEMTRSQRRRRNKNKNKNKNQNPTQPQDVKDIKNDVNLGGVTKPVEQEAPKAPEKKEESPVVKTEEKKDDEKVTVNDVSEKENKNAGN